MAGKKIDFKEALKQADKIIEKRTRKKADKVTGYLVPDTGCPALEGSDGKIVIESSYSGIAVLEEKGEIYICLSPFWEGVLPTEYIGTALKLERSSK